MVAPFPRDVEPEPTVPRSISGPFGMRHGGVARGHFWTATFKLGHYQTEENALQKMGMGMNFRDSLNPVRRSIVFRW